MMKESTGVVGMKTNSESSDGDQPTYEQLLRAVSLASLGVVIFDRKGGGPVPMSVISSEWLGMPSSVAEEGWDSIGKMELKEDGQTRLTVARRVGFDERYVVDGDCGDGFTVADGDTDSYIAQQLGVLLYRLWSRIPAGGGSRAMTPPELADMVIHRLKMSLHALTVEPVRRAGGKSAPPCKEAIDDWFAGFMKKTRSTPRGDSRPSKKHATRRRK